MPYNPKGLTAKERFFVILFSLPASLTVAGTLAVCGFLTGISTGRLKILFGVLVVFFAILTALIAYLRQSRTGVLKQVATRVARSVAGSGTPVLIALGELTKASSGPEADQRLAALKGRILETARNYCGDVPLESKRAVLYLFEDHGDHLRLGDWIGRDVPRTTFPEDEIPLGREVVEFAQGRRGGRYAVKRVEDVSTDMPPGHIDPNTCSYTSFMCTPLIVGDHSYGLLAVDSTRKQGFLAIDEGTLSLLAGVLVAGLAARRSALVS